MTMMELLVLLGIISTFALGIAGVWYIIWEFVLTPKVSKIIRNASIRHQSLVLMMMGNNVIHVVAAKVFPEGYLETMEKPAHAIPILRPKYENQDADDFDPNNPNPEDNVEATKTAQSLWEHNRTIGRLEKESLGVTAFEGCKIPVYQVFAGLAVAVNPNVPLSLQYEKDRVRGQILTRKWWTKSDGWQYRYDNVDVLLPIKPSVLKKHISMNLDQSVLDGFGHDRYQRGFRAGHSQKDVKLMLLLGFGLCIIGAVLIALNLFV